MLEIDSGKVCYIIIKARQVCAPAVGEEEDYGANAAVPGGLTGWRGLLTLLLRRSPRISVSP